MRLTGIESVEPERPRRRNKIAFGLGGSMKPDNLALCKGSPQGQEMNSRNMTGIGRRSNWPGNPQSREMPAYRR